MKAADEARVFLSLLLDEFSLAHPTPGIWARALRYLLIWKLEHFFGERKNAKFSVSGFCISLENTVNINIRISQIFFL